MQNLNKFKADELSLTELWQKGEGGYQPNRLFGALYHVMMSFHHQTHTVPRELLCEAA